MPPRRLPCLAIALLLSACAGPKMPADTDPANLNDASSRGMSGRPEVPVTRLKDCTLTPAQRTTQQAMLDELNFARTQPARYAAVVEANYAGLGDDRIYLRDGVRIRMNEGLPAVREAVAFLRQARPVPPLRAFGCLSSAAQSHVKDQGPRGAIGHAGSDGSDPARRAAKALGRKAACGENISYGPDNPRDHVIGLIVDDGVANRGHRENIFLAEYRSFGAAVGPHKVYRQMAVHMMCFEDFRDVATPAGR
ncbi:CAP domain-containing protein [Sphaerotilus mobilis]|uniref:Cysteine-rich secretory family protein n=1 Tax=Sphaerotilus mobilis TaxID=47994 RepID=A0A4Q7LQ76_9BURK|nr:CAP domain-containing protein [Sphaerotilus mobilis]RZS56966.1 cysteine-rich secretory family protein [Sphaerotilus mobilis]